MYRTKREIWEVIINYTWKSWKNGTCLISLMKR